MRKPKTVGSDAPAEAFEESPDMRALDTFTRRLLKVPKEDVRRRIAAEKVEKSLGLERG